MDKHRKRILESNLKSQAMPFPFRADETGTDPRHMDNPVDSKT